MRIKEVPTSVYTSIAFIFMAISGVLLRLNCFVVGYYCVGCAIFFAIVSIVFSLLQPHKESSKDKEVSPSISSLFEELPAIQDKSLFSDKPTPQEIKDNINSQPPYLRKMTSDAYIGLRVHWILTLKFVFAQDDDGVIGIQFNNFIDGAIDTKEFPAIKTAMENTRFEVWAEIADIVGEWIHLGISDIKLLE
jgi:hypothetical protein